MNNKRKKAQWPEMSQRKRRTEQTLALLFLTRCVVSRQLRDIGGGVVAVQGEVGGLGWVGLGARKRSLPEFCMSDAGINVGP